MAGNLNYQFVPRKGDLADFETWEKDGKPLKPYHPQPLSRLRNLRQVNMRQNQFQQVVRRDRPYQDNITVARQPFGNQAPQLPLDVYRQISSDNVDSSALPQDYYSNFYLRGGIAAAADEAKDLILEGGEYDRVDEHIRTEEELLAFRRQYFIGKGGILTLPEWNPLMFPPDGTCVAFGARRTGKSWLFRELLCQYRHLYRAVIVVTNTKQNGFWNKYVPFKYIHSPYDPFVIEQILDHQRKTLARNMIAQSPMEIVSPYIAVVLDDVVSANLMHDSALKQLFYEGRHSCIAIFISTQYPKAIPPGVRGNADLAVVFPQESMLEQDAIREQYFNFFESKDDFYAALMENTQDHQCMVLNLSEKSIPQIRRIYSYKSEDPGPFVLGCKEFWDGDEEARMKYYQALAGIGGGDSGTGADYDMFSNEAETDALIRSMTF